MLENFNTSKNYKIRQYVNGSFISLTDITCSKNDYDSLLSIMLMPQAEEIVDEYNLFHFLIKDKKTNQKIYFKIALSKTTSDLDVFNAIKGKIFNGVKVDVVILTSFERMEASNIIKQGLDFENHVSDYYQSQGYEVINNFEKGRYDEGIGIILIKDDELQLIQCKNWEIHSIRHNEIKEFLGNCYLFLYKNIEYRKYTKVKRIYVTSQSILDTSAKLLIKNYYPFVEYLKIPYKSL